MRKISKIIVSFVFTFVILSAFRFNTKAETISNKVYVGGENIGIKLNTGIEVIGKYEVETEHGKVEPWKNSNIQKGDYIISIEGIKVENNQSLLNILSSCKKDRLKLLIERNDKRFETSIDVVISINNQKSLGLYIKDKLMGIGTLTFIDPNDNYFASLGHGIYHNDELYDVSNGVILSSTVNSIRKATPGNAGEKKATLDNKVVGTILDNKITGVYGKILKNNYQNKNLIEIGKKEEIKIGPATIVTTLTDNIPKEYQIEIIDLVEQDNTGIKGIKIRVTDERLIKETGGIVQGMSGSPILQNGKLIGAVSHVIVDNPNVGYGMYIEWMIEDLNGAKK